MLKKLAVLKFGLGSKYDGIVIRDVQLWRDEEDGDMPPVRCLKGSFLQYVDLKKLPLWVTHGGSVSTCLTSSSTTLSYFTSKLRNDSRGIVVEVVESKRIYVILYRYECRIQCLEVNLMTKSAIDSQIRNLESVDEKPTTKDSNIDVILRQSQERQVVNNKKILKNLQVSEKRLQFNETLSKLILGGLRLRGLPNSQFGFQKLYKMTFSAAEFAHRNELQQMTGQNGPEISFENLQATVETLLQLFTKS